MSYQIITDSSCDLYEEQYQELNVPYANLKVLIDGVSTENFNDDKKISEFYEKQRNGMISSTSGANPEDWTALMIPYLQKGVDVLLLAFSSGLSTTYQSAEIAAQELREQYPERTIRVVDTRCAALGQGLLLIYTCRQRDAGMSLEELINWVEDNKLRVCHWVTVDDLSYLKRGGRISATTAMVGTMLNIKPIIHVDEEGKLISCAKVRGRKASIQYLADKLGQSEGDYTNETITIAHGDCLEDAQELAKLVRETYGVKDIRIGRVGPVIGSHTGPSVLVLFFMGSVR